jgi:hypothetical protein
MARINSCEMEIDAIRDKIYEETKYMTREEQAKRLRDRTQILAALGFTKLFITTVCVL